MNKFIGEVFYINEDKYILTKSPYSGGYAGCVYYCDLFYFCSRIYVLQRKNLLGIFCGLEKIFEKDVYK